MKAATSPPLPRARQTSRPERRFTGYAAAPGVAVGPAFHAVEPDIPLTRTKIAAADIAAEGARLDTAVAQSRKQLNKLRGRLAVLPEESQAEIAPLIDAYLRMVGPSRLVRGSRRRIEETLLSAESAVMAEADTIALAIQDQAEPGLNAEDRAGLHRRAEEVREIGRRIVRNLTRTPFRSFAGLPRGAVLVSESLRPSDAALLDPARLAGVATDEGGADGHTAVMLRALGVPSVLGAAGLSHAARPGDTLVVDGVSGTVILSPGAETLANTRRAVTTFARETQRLSRLRTLEARTTDGELVDLQANFELPIELPLIARSGARGIGLLRTEFLFMNRDTVPDEAAQLDSYRTVIEAMNGDPVTIRVLDWGGEKDIEALSNAGLVPDLSDVNPAMGLRGLRLLLRRPELFETQLAAILRASIHGPVRVLLPMVTTVTEVRAAREIYDRVARRLRRRGERLPDRLPPMGLMIETPGAALSADALALEADFFAIGTNDLTAHTLAVNRGESDVAEMYDPLHPAVLRLIQFATEAALRMRMPVSLCGEIAGDPRATPLLLGLGLRSFSMNAPAVPRVKQVVRGVDAGDCIRFARRVMEQSDPERIGALLAGFSPGGGA